MKHELFRIFAVLNEEVENDSAVVSFLSSGITPKSISVNHDVETATLIIGYTTDTPYDTYHIVKKLVVVDPTLPRSKVEELLNEAAVDLDGVVCQDVLLLEDTIIIIFLTTK